MLVYKIIICVQESIIDKSDTIYCRKEKLHPINKIYLGFTVGKNITSVLRLKDEKNIFQIIRNVNLRT